MTPARMPQPPPRRGLYWYWYGLFFIFWYVEYILIYIRHVNGI